MTRQAPSLLATFGLAAALALTAAANVPPPRRNLLFTGDFDNFATGSVLGRVAPWSRKEALFHELRVVTAPTRAGGKALRVEVNKHERNQGGGSWRAEVLTFNTGGDSGGHDVVRWYGLSTFVPADWVNDPSTDIIFQFHEIPDAGEDWRSPPLYLRVNDNKLEWNARWDSKPLSVGNTPEGSATIYTGPLVKGRWVDWVLTVRWDFRPGGNGFVEIWRDGTRQPVYNGPNCYNDQKPLYLKAGLYRFGWDSTAFSQRVIFHDEIRVGSEKATYADVAPASKE